MKVRPSVIALTAAWLLPGCVGDSVAGSTNEGSIDCAIEFQIAAVSGLKQDDRLNDGDWRIAASCVLPVHSDGGPGHVVCNTDGTIVDIQWADVRLVDDGKSIAFGDCRWAIRNRIDRRDGVSHTIGGQSPNDTTYFSTDFQWLASCELDTALRQRSGRRLVIRGRLLPEAPPAQPLNLADMTGLSR